ncbi:MAG: flagellin [Vampirovibrionales bacterium]
MMTQRLPLITNYRSLQTIFRLNSSSEALDKFFKQASTGNRLNSAVDDISGFAISKTLQAQIKATDRSAENIQDANNLLSVTEGAVSTMGDSLQRIRELLVQGGSDTSDTSARSAILKEVRGLLDSIDNQASSVRFNGLALLDGSLTGASATAQIGSDSSASSKVDLSAIFVATNTTTLGVVNGPNAGAIIPNLNAIYNPATQTTAITTNANFLSLMGDIDVALDRVNARRSLIGAYQSQLNAALTNQQAKSLNFSDTEARIRSADVAALSTQLASQQLVQQSALQVLQQNNQFPQRILQLLQQG